MQYAVPEELTIGDFAIGWNTQLSQTDRTFIGVMYPQATSAPGQLTVGQTVQASIGSHGEEDHYWFDVGANQTGQYVVETLGRTDVLMGLYGPDDPAGLIATDDDSGVELNARIVRKLGPGRYHVRVRHYSPRGTGKYDIRVRRF
jgi:tyrosinase